MDLFLYGLTPEQANAKLQEIYFAVTEANPHEVVCFRSKHAVTLVSQYPFRHIQIILRLYKSPAEVLHLDLVQGACEQLDIAGDSAVQNRVAPLRSMTPTTIAVLHVFARLATAATSGPSRSTASRQ